MEEERVEALEETIKEEDKAIDDLTQKMDLNKSSVRSTFYSNWHDFPKLSDTNPRFEIRIPPFDKELELPLPSTEELSQGLIELLGQDVVVVESCNLIFKSTKAHYYTICISPIGLVTLKVCLDSDVEEKDSFKRSKEMFETHNAIAMVVRPILSFQFRVKFHCFIFDNFKPFDLGVKMGSTLVPTQLNILKDILLCLSFLSDKGGHGRVDNSSVCGLVLCHGRGMVTDLMPKSWPVEPSTPYDYKAYGSVIEKRLSLLFNGNLPQNWQYFITQLKNVSFNDRMYYNCFEKHPIFYSNMKKLLYFMFGSTETNVMVAQNAKKNVGLKGQNKTGLTYEKLFGNVRLTERAKVDFNLQKHLDIIGSYPRVVSTSPPLIPLGSSSASHPSSSSSPSLVSTLAFGCSSPSSPPPSPSVVFGSGSPSLTARFPSPSVFSSGSGSPAGSPSTSVSRFYWKNVYRANSEIEAIWDQGNERNVKYDYTTPLDYLRFVRNVYAHIPSLSQLNENQREGLFREVDKMWPGFIYALFLTVSEMGTVIDV